MSDPDAHIINEMRAGNLRAFGALVDRHRDRAFTLAVRLLGNRHDAEEAVQDAFVRAYRGLGNFRGDARFTTWFTRIVHNLCLSRLSRKDRPEQELADEDDAASGGDEGSEAGPLDQLEEKDLLDLVQSRLEVLPERYRTAITLFYVQEMSYEEIAAVLSQPVGTVKTNLFRARVMLKEQVRRVLRKEMVA